MSGYKVVILIPADGRHDLTRAVLEHTARLRRAVTDECRLSALVAMSEGDVPAMAPVCARQRLAWIVAPNRPVSLKHQTGLEAIRRRFPKCDAVILCGSDDFLSAGYVRLAVRCAKAGRNVGPDRCYVLDAASGGMGLWDKPFSLPDRTRISLGPGRIFTRELLEDVGWRVWPFAQDCRLDGSSSEHLQAAGWLHEPLDLSGEPEAFVLDVKPANGHSITSFRRLVGAGLEPIPSETRRAIIAALGASGRSAYLTAALATKPIPPDADPPPPVPVQVRLLARLHGAHAGQAGDVLTVPPDAARQLAAAGMATICEAKKAI